MIVNRESLSAIFVNLNTSFNKVFSAVESMWPQIAMKVPSTSGANDYKWLSQFPKMQRWVGDKKLKSLEGFKYVVENEDFEATVEVKRNDIEDDNLGIYGTQAQGAGESAAQFPDELVFEAVNGVFTNVCFDGQFFCDTDHPVKNPATGLPESVSNKGVAVLSAATQAAAIASIGAAATAMGSFKDNEGRPLNVTPNVLLVGVALRDMANTLYTADRLEDGKVNLYKGLYKPVVSPRMTSSTAWMLLDTTKVIKPFVYQERKAPVFVQQTDPQSDDVFNRGTYKFGAEARAASGYGFWQLGWASTGLGA
ncbi:head protein [candidate division KSB1 bacterium RBG_16_48_16]|nr:MAG: head protein [candidate division KSB1 bacterium RBG_16_48_16]